VGPEEGTAYLNLARIATLRGELPQAARLLDDAWEIQRKWGLRGLAADVLEAEANLLRESGDPAAGERYAAPAPPTSSWARRSRSTAWRRRKRSTSRGRSEIDRAERAVLEVLDRARHGDRSEAIASALSRSARSGCAGKPREGDRAAEGGARSLRRPRPVLPDVRRRAVARVGRRPRSGSSALRLAAEMDYAGLVARVRAATAPAVDEAAAPLPGRLHPSSADLTVRLLGPVEVYRDEDRKIPASAWRLRRALKVFCYLAAARNHRATKSRIARRRLGRPRAARSSSGNFHPTISFLRKALNHGHGVAKNFILCEGGAYALNPTTGTTSTSIASERHPRTPPATRRRRATSRPSRSAYDDAIALYRGPFLEEDDEEWVEAPQTALRVLLDAALRELADVHASLGRAEEAIAPLERLVERHPRTKAPRSR
jgi:DNA-binding SARP family transcriptional activator